MSFEIEYPLPEAESVASYPLPVRSFHVVEAPLIELTSFASKLKIAPEVIVPAVALESRFGVMTIEVNVIRDATRHTKTGNRDFEVRIGHPQ